MASEHIDKLKGMLEPRSLFFVPESDTRASIAWAVREIERLAAEVEATKTERADLRQEVSRMRQVIQQRSEAVKRIAKQLFRTA